MLNGSSADLLGTISLFHDLTPVQLSKLSSYLHRKTFPARTSVLTLEQPGEAVYFLLSGTVKVCIEQISGTDVILDICGAGEVLGEISVLDGLSHSASVITIETSNFLWIDRTTFCECVQTMPVMAYNLARVLARRLRRTSIHTQSLTTLDVHGRVACHILDFANEYGVTATNGDILIPIRLTQSDLAALIGASRESTNKALAFYKRNKILSIDGHHRITVHNEAALCKRCQ